MKKSKLPLIVFALAFVAVYLVLCYHPALMIKLAADPLIYFVESVKHAAFSKGIFSLAAGLIAAGITAAIQRRVRK